MIAESDRRQFLKLSALAGSAVLLEACGARTGSDQNSSNAAGPKTSESDKKE
jgi:nitrous oxide reductase